MAWGSKQKIRDAERSPVSELSDDLLVEIISRLPYRSTRRCKCVCRRWRDLISHPDHGKKLPTSTLAGFFSEAYNETCGMYASRRFQSISRSWCPCVNGDLWFLPKCEGVDIFLLDSCNGLLLLRRWEGQGSGSKVVDYMVCNPITETWVTVPATTIGWSDDEPDARLGFNPAVSSHFYVFEFLHAGMWEADKRYYNGRIKSVGIYSSEAGVWTHRSAWDQLITFYGSSRSAFLDGELYFSSYDDFVIAVVDMEGNSRVICFLTPHEGRVAPDLYLSQGQLYLAHYGTSQLSIWALEDSRSEKWTLKHIGLHVLTNSTKSPN